MNNRSTCPTLRVTKVLEVSIVLYLASLCFLLVSRWQALSSGSELGLGMETSLSILLLRCVYWIVVLFLVARLARANRALEAQGLAFSPRMAVLSYFMPVLNFFMPYLAMQEAWQVSNPHSSETDWKSTGGSGLVKAWWGLNLTGIAIGLYAMIYEIGAGLNPDSPSANSDTLLQLDIATDLMAGITALLMLGIAKTVSNRYQAKWDLRFGPKSVPTAKVQDL